RQLRGASASLVRFVLAPSSRPAGASLGSRRAGTRKPGRVPAALGSGAPVPGLLGPGALGPEALGSEAPGSDARLGRALGSAWVRVWGRRPGGRSGEPVAGSGPNR